MTIRQRQYRRAIESAEDMMHSPSTVLTTLAGQDTFFGEPGQSPAATELQWGLPAVFARRRLQEKQWLHAQNDLQGNLLHATLLGLDTFFGAPGQSPNQDWTQWGPPKTWPRFERQRLVAQNSQMWVMGVGSYNTFWRSQWVSQPPYAARYDQVIRRAFKTGGGV